MPRNTIREWVTKIPVQLRMHLDHNVGVGFGLIWTVLIRGASALRNVCFFFLGGGTVPNDRLKPRGGF